MSPLLLTPGAQDMATGLASSQQPVLQLSRCPLRTPWFLRQNQAPSTPPGPRAPYKAPALSVQSHGMQLGEPREQPLSGHQAGYVQSNPAPLSPVSARGEESISLMPLRLPEAKPEQWGSIAPSHMRGITPGTNHTGHRHSGCREDWQGGKSQMPTHLFASTAWKTPGQHVFSNETAERGCYLYRPREGMPEHLLSTS